MNKQELKDLNAELIELLMLVRDHIDDKLNELAEGADGIDEDEDEEEDA